MNVDAAVTLVSCLDLVPEKRRRREHFGGCCRYNQPTKPTSLAPSEILLSVHRSSKAHRRDWSLFSPSTHPFQLRYVTHHTKILCQWMQFLPPTLIGKLLGIESLLNYLEVTIIYICIKVVLYILLVNCALHMYCMVDYVWLLLFEKLIFQTVRVGNE